MGHLNVKGIAAGLMLGAAAVTPFNALAGDAQAAALPVHPFLVKTEPAGVIFGIGLCGAAADVIGGADGAQSCGAIFTGLMKALTEHKEYAVIGTDTSKTTADIAVATSGGRLYNTSYLPVCFNKVGSNHPATGAISPKTGEFHFFDTGYRGDCDGFFQTRPEPWDVTDGKPLPSNAPQWNPDLTDPFGNPREKKTASLGMR